MGNNDLKGSLTKFPEPEWDKGLDFNQISKSQFTSALSEILKEYGKFPVPWSAGGLRDGFYVEGADDRYIGDWKTVKNNDENECTALVTEACEDLGDAESASKIIFRTYFSKLLPRNSDDEVKTNNG